MCPVGDESILELSHVDVINVFNNWMFITEVMSGILEKNVFINVIKYFRDEYVLLTW